jgi:four helix bundle protein
MQIKTDNAILKLTFDFALLIMEYCEILENEKKYTIARQLLKSGTSIGANVKEAQNAESKSDFIHKMKIAAKEGDETEYWLLLCKYSKRYPNCEHLIDQNKVINKVLAKIIGTSKKRLLP